MTASTARSAVSAGIREKKAFWIWAPAISLIIASAILIEFRDKIYDWQSFLAALLVPVGGPLALIWLFWFWWYGANYKKYKNWDGVVTKKEIKEYDETKRDGNGNKYQDHSTFYTLYFKDDRERSILLWRGICPGALISLKRASGCATTEGIQTTTRNTINRDWTRSPARAAGQNSIRDRITVHGVDVSC